jgi:cyclic dehypoxanthinyl futalosine synthase
LASAIANLLDGAVAGERLSPEQALLLLQSHDLASLARAADEVTRRKHPEPYRTYNVDRNVNYTNVCTSGCRFCAFSRTPGDPQGYVIDRRKLYEKIDETIRLGGD